MKDFGALTYFLGFGIFMSRDGIRIHQCKYTDNLIKSARLSDTKMFDTPLELNVKINRDDGCQYDDPTVVRCLVGSLLYLTMTRPNMYHGVHIVIHFVGNPHQPHLVAVHRILRYLKGTHDRGLFYPSSSSFQF